MAISLKKTNEYNKEGLKILKHILAALPFMNNMANVYCNRLRHI